MLESRNDNAAKDLGESAAKQGSKSAAHGPENALADVLSAAAQGSVADAVTELAAALADAATDSDRRARDRDIASLAWRRVRSQRRLAAA